MISGTNSTTKKEETMMKRLFVLVLVSAFLFGCGAAATQSEFWQHDTMYKNWDHMKFSMAGYKSPTEETYQKSAEQEWWGIEVPYIPAK
jgi:outer membrane lipoprotein-sorting protein